MQGHRFSAYEYLTFIFPGATVTFVAFFGWNGWPYEEPGAGAIIGLVSVSFLVGHALAALANWVEPVWWGNRPGRAVSSTQGLFGTGGLYNPREEKEIQDVLARAFPQLEGTQNRFRAAYSRAQEGPLGGKIQTFVEQIGFYRSMAASTALGIPIVGAYCVTGRDHLPCVLWIPALGIATFAFVLRYRRFWIRTGDYVVRDVIVRNNKDLG